MPTQINPLAPSNLSIIAASVVANQTTGTIATNLASKLDLRKKDGAQILVSIGRRATAALTRGAFVGIRATDNDTLVHIDQRFDVTQASATTAAVTSTISGTPSAGAMSITVASGTSFAIGDRICISQSGGTAISFNQIARVSGNTLSLMHPLERGHNNGDDVFTLAHQQTMPLPGGDIYYIFANNDSSQPVVIRVDAVVLNGVEVVTT